MNISFNGSPNVASLIKSEGSEQGVSTLALAGIHHHISSFGSLSFLDSINLTHSAPNNLTPLKQDLQLEITRSLPGDPLPLPAENAFSKAFTQQTEYYNQAVKAPPLNHLKNLLKKRRRISKYV